MASNLFKEKAEKKAISNISNRLENSRINLTAKQSEEDPATVSYNTKVFNREVVALRNE